MGIFDQKVHFVVLSAITSFIDRIYSLLACFRFNIHAFKTFCMRILKVLFLTSETIISDDLGIKQRSQREEQNYDFFSNG